MQNSFTDKPEYKLLFFHLLWIIVQMLYYYYYYYNEKIITTKNTQPHHRHCHTWTYYHTIGKSNIWQSVTYWSKFSQALSLASCGYPVMRDEADLRQLRSFAFPSFLSSLHLSPWPIRRRGERRNFFSGAHGSPDRQRYWSIFLPREVYA